MPVGTVSSAHNLGSSTPVEPKFTTETISSTQTALNAPGSKTYYHQVPGANFFMPNGLRLQFLGGVFITADPAIQAELDAVVDQAPSMITSGRERQAQLAEQLAAQAAATTESTGQ